VAEALLRTARIAADDLTFIDEESIRLWDEIAQKQENAISLDKEKFLELPPALKRHLLRTAIENLSGLKDIETRHIEEILDALAKPAGKRLDLPGGLNFSIDYDSYLIGTDLAALAPFPVLKGESRLKIPGETLLPSWRVEATITTPESIKDAGDYEAYFDLDKSGNRITVRSRQTGDRFQPLGMSQPKKLNKFMIDAKIPRAWRQRIPIVCSSEHIIWVIGQRIDDRAKVTEKTKRVLCLTMVKQ
jgi:tRNA(Ile)-lysidine synthase